MRNWVTISQRLIMIGQLGLSLLMPLLMCMGGLLSSHDQTGNRALDLLSGLYIRPWRVLYDSL